MFKDPTNLETTTPILFFFTRSITHFLNENWRELILVVDRFKKGYLFNIGFDLWVTYLV